MKRGEDGGLTPESLEALLRALDPDRNRAGERYEEIRRRLIRFFQWRGSQSAEELADVTITRVARQLLAGLVLRSDLYAYFCGVARLVHLEDVRKEASRNKSLDLQPPWTPGDAEEDPDPRLEHLRHCLQTLTPDQQELVLRYHQGEQRIQDRKRLCRDLGIEMNALRIRVHRLRRRIETCIQERSRPEPSREP